MINLRSNYPSLDEEKNIFTSFVSHHLDADKVRQPPVQLSPEYWFALLSPLLAVPVSQLIFINRVETCSSGNQALFSILFAYRAAHPVIGVEAFTYNNCKAIAGLLGYQLVSLSCDEEGLQPNAVKTAIDNGVRLFYVQPTIHNPTCSVMSGQRRQAIAELIQNSNAMLIEDDAYRFLHPAPPPSFLKLLPGKTIYICSLSKPFNSFIKSCFIVLPKQVLPNLSAVIDKAGNTMSSLSVAMSQYVLQLPAFDDLIVAKQKQAERIQQQIQPALDGLVYTTFFTSYHVWITLPNHCNSITFAEQLKAQQILVTGSHEYSAVNDTGFIRVALSGEENIDALVGAITKTKTLLLS